MDANTSGAYTVSWTILKLVSRAAWRLEGQSEQAKARFEKALALDPQLPSKLIEAGKALAARGQTNAAIERFQSAVWLQPRNEEAKVQLERLRGAVR